MISASRCLGIWMILIVLEIGVGRCLEFEVFLIDLSKKGKGWILRYFGFWVF
jgi:hypothetical protein